MNQTFFSAFKMTQLNKDTKILNFCNETFVNMSFFNCTVEFIITAGSFTIFKFLFFFFLFLLFFFLLLLFFFFLLLFFIFLLFNFFINEFLLIILHVNLIKDRLLHDFRILCFLLWWSIR